MFFQRNYFDLNYFNLKIKKNTVYNYYNFFFLKYYSKFNYLTTTQTINKDSILIKKKYLLQFLKFYKPIDVFTNLSINEKRFEYKSFFFKNVIFRNFLIPHYFYKLKLKTTLPNSLYKKQY